MHFNIITLFPEIFLKHLGTGVIGRAIKAGLINYQCYNPRDFTNDKHNTVDDKPFGGGAGMVMKIEPLAASLKEVQIKSPKGKVYYISPQGKKLTQNYVQELSKQESMILVCGRYEGVDQRFIDNYVDEEISIGDYILTGGELPALVLIDSISRLLPGVLGDFESSVNESFTNNLLDYPSYTRPADYQGLKVPQVLLTGNHKEIAKWRSEKQLEITKLKRPDLLAEKLKKD